MIAPNVRPLESDRRPDYVSSGMAAEANPSHVHARQAVVEPMVGDEAAARGPYKRGALRPAQLITTRARHETAAVERLFRIGDGLTAIAVAAALASLAHPEGLLNAPFGAMLPLLAGVGSLIWSLRMARCYGVERREGVIAVVARVFPALLVAAVIDTAMIVLIRPDRADAIAAGAWIAVTALTLSASQVIWWRQVTAWRASGRLTPNIVVVGATENARKLIGKACESRRLAVLGVFDDRLSRAPADVAGVPVLGDTEALLGHRIMPCVDRVVITVPPQAQGRVRQLIEKLKVLPNEVSLFLDFEGEAAQSAALSRLAEAPLARLSGAGQDNNRVLAKRLQDLAFGVVALVIAVPVMALVALAVRLDSPGPVLFRQRRHGFNNEEIVVWKFRSMRHDAADPTASKQVVADDERVTRVGRMIRKFSLDELPQLFNVLKGDMALVGPRPHAIGMKTGEVESAKLVAEYAWRHRMKPGVTGWAAVNGSRGPVHTPEDVRRRVELDVEYIERQSFWFDLYILTMTIPCLAFGDRLTVR